MLEKNLGKRFTKNLIFAFSAQGLSFVFSVLMSLLVPKVLGVEQYSYWQLFIFYSTYVGFFHFGLSDGVYLRYGGTEFEDLDKESIGSQFKLMIIWQIIICICVLPFLLHFAGNTERQYIWILVAVYLVVANATWYLGYIFQAANRTSVYSTSIIISKSSYILFILAMLVIRPKSFRPFVAFYVAAQGIAFLYIAYIGRSFIFTRIRSLKATIQGAISNISIGINLTISNIVSSLILGIGRAMVDRTAGLESFGLLSLAITLTNFFLQFIAQVSMVMFPALRQINEESMKRIFVKLRSGISYLLTLILLVFVPFKIILSWWLPQYTESIRYLAFLLPICVFDGKMQLLFNTYMKVLRKERIMLIINMISLGISAVLCAIGAYLIKDIVAVAIAMMVAIVMRSIISNSYLSKAMNIRLDKNIIWEVALAFIFIFANAYTSSLIAFVIYGVAYGFYVMLNLNEIKGLLNTAKRKLIKTKNGA